MSYKEKINLQIDSLINLDNSSSIDKSFKNFEEIESYNIDYINQIISLTVTNKKIIVEIIQKLNDLGFVVSTTNITFPVVGMSCVSCAKSIENLMNYDFGVLDTSVNYASGKVTFKYLPNMTNPNLLKKTMRSIGYDIIIEDKESENLTLEKIKAKKLKILKLKTIWSIIFSLPLFIIGMFFMNISYYNYIMWALSTPVIFWIGKDFFINAWKQAKNKSANMDTLVALSTGIAYLFSVFNMLFTDIWHKYGLHSHVYFEASAVIITFILIGKILEEKAKNNTSTALKKLMDLQVKSVVIVKDDGSEELILVEDVKINDIIQVKPGEKIAVDGTVLTGNSYVDESMLSGEPIAVLKKNGEKVFAGTLNQKGSFKFKAEKIGKETILSQIIQKVQDAQASKAPVQKLVDKIASIFVPTVLFLSILTFFLWLIFDKESGIANGIQASITILIIACPCALGLATPTAIIVGIGKGAENGILIKDAESLEIAKKVDTIILDKTGTITEGKPEVIDEFSIVNNALNNILINIEKLSEHPLAEAVVRHYKNSHFEPITLNSFESITGKGVKAKYSKNTYYVGNKKFLIENNIYINNDFNNVAIQWENEAKTVIWFSDNEKVLSIFSINDKIKNSSISAINELKEMGIDLHILTGDNETTTDKIARQIGIKKFKAGMLPQNKAEYVHKLQNDGKIVAMVGDGINDSTALAMANLSIAMGKGSDIAKEVANMTIISSDLKKIPKAINLSKQTVNTIKQNLFWAFIYNIISIPLAGGILYFYNGFMLDPMIAGGAMALSSVSVISNSLILKIKKI